MPGPATTILSGTRDELGGVDIGVVNIYERPERSGVVSAQLILPEDKQIIAPGDHVDLGGRRFRLDSIEPHASGAYSLQFSDITPPPTPAQANAGTPIAPIAPAGLAQHLRDHAATALAALGHAISAPLAWEHASRDTFHTEWNGEQTGPITSLTWTAILPEGTEARIGLDFIRYNADELHRAEVTAFWKVGQRTFHLFGRAEGTADITRLLGDTEHLAAVGLA